MTGTTQRRQSERELFRKHAELFGVLANPLRHEIVHRLAESDRTGSELVALTGASKATVSQHVSLLRAYGLVAAERRGRSITYRLAYPQLAGACRLIDEVLLDQARQASRLVGREHNDDAPSLGAAEGSAS
jgi:ArsR family transcriptional regulator